MLWPVRRLAALDRWGRFRLILLLLAALTTLQIIAIAQAARERAADTARGYRFPLPSQAVAIAQLVENAPDAALPTLLEAVNSPDLRVAVLDATAPNAQTPPQAQRIGGVERLVRAYSDALAPLEVAVYLASEPGDPAPRFSEITMRASHLISDRPLRIDISLSGGRLLRIETRGDLTRRLFGWPLGLWTGVVGLVLALLAVSALWREIRPLKELSARVDRFARAARPQLMEEKGPPEIRSVISAFNRMQTRISELLGARSIMLGALGHDLRTYLTRLRLRADLIEQPALQEPMVRDLAAMDSVIAASSMLARLEGAPLEAQETALAPIFKALAEAHPWLEISEAARATDAVVWGDRDAIYMALENLVVNAERHGAAAHVGAAVQIALQVEDDPLGAIDPRAHIMVLDRGPGVDAAQAGRLFDPFVRGDAARNLDAPGSGLGLAIVAAVAKVHRGGAALRNREGGGLEARLTLPVAF